MNRNPSNKSEDQLRRIPEYHSSSTDRVYSFTNPDKEGPLQIEKDLKDPKLNQKRDMGTKRLSQFFSVIRREAGRKKDTILTLVTRKVERWRSSTFVFKRHRSKTVNGKFSESLLV